MLAVRDFMVRGLNLEAHPLEHIDDRAPRILAEICGCEIEVRPDVVRDSRWLFIRPRLEHEELGFHPRVHRIAGRSGSREYFFQHASWITRKRVAIGSIDIANQSGNVTILLTPGKDLKRAEVR